MTPFSQRNKMDVRGQATNTAINAKEKSMTEMSALLLRTQDRDEYCDQCLSVLWQTQLSISFMWRPAKKHQKNKQECRYDWLKTLLLCRENQLKMPPGTFFCSSALLLFCSSSLLLFISAHLGHWRTGTGAPLAVQTDL